MQDEIVARLATQLGTVLIASEARRAERTPNPDAFDLYLQGMAWLDKDPRPANVAQSRAFFARALAIEPDNVDALIGSAGANFWEAINSANPERAARFASAEVSLLKALSAAPDNAMAHMWLSFVRINSNRAARGIADAERALALNRNLPRALMAMGLAKLMVGRAEETEGYLQDALNLSPRDPLAFNWMFMGGMAKIHLGAYEEAARWLSQSVGANPNFPAAHILLAAALSQLGQVEEARAEARAGLVLDPTFTIRRFQDRDVSDNPIFLKQCQNIYEGMRRAGVPEQ
jgi:tetratricopeptide (TPR) repeat protein